MAEIILTGDALEQLRHLPPESVQMPWVGVSSSLVSGSFRTLGAR